MKNLPVIAVSVGSLLLIMSIRLVYLGIVHGGDQFTDGVTLFGIGTILICQGIYFEHINPQDK
jgi:hypothetical protein